MDNFDLNKKFLATLKAKYSKQAELISVVGDILKIERESAYRRIKGSVLFTIREMGIIVRHLNISLDNLLVDDNTNVVYLRMLRPRLEESLVQRVEKIEGYLKTLQDISDISDTEVGAVYTHLPMEFYLPYDNLFRFIYFRWGIYYSGSERYGKFSNWKIPENISKHLSGMSEAYEKLKSVFYIWDRNIIGDLINDIKFFLSAGILEQEEVDIIKREIHLMLNDLERLVAEGDSGHNFEKIEFYISNINIGITYVYAWSKAYKFSYMVNLTVLSTINEDERACENVRKWVKSLKKISTLISGTGERERLLFFKEQHQIVDSL